MEIDHLPPHPNPLPNPHHRKLELQSPLDLTYIRENIARAAQERLDLHFPVPVHTSTKTARPQDDDATRGRDEATTATTTAAAAAAAATDPTKDLDPMRARVSFLVAQFLARTFEHASHSISINGIDNTDTDTNRFSTTTSTTPPDPQAPPGQEPPAEREGRDFLYEPYDPRLSSQVASLYAELERETLAVSRLRRSAPREGAERWGGELMRVLDADAVDAADAEGEGGGDGWLRLEALADGSEEEIRELYERSLAGLRRLGGVVLHGVGDMAGYGDADVGVDAGVGGARGGGSLTETLAKVQRARDVAMEMEV